MTDKIRFLFEPKNKEEIIKVQDILFKNGYSWSGYCEYRNNIVTVAFKLDNKLLQYSNNDIDYVMSYFKRSYDGYENIIVKNITELNRLFVRKINYNEPKQLIYE